MKRFVLICWLILFISFFLNIIHAYGYSPSEMWLRAELARAGYVAIPGKTFFYGVPVVIIWNPEGTTVEEICLQISELKREMPFSRDIISRYSRIFPGERVNWLVIPLTADLPRIFPLADSKYAGNNAGTLVISRKKKWAAVYRGEERKYQFPVWFGSRPDDKPAKDSGIIQFKANYLPNDGILRIVIGLGGIICLFDDPDVKPVYGDAKALPEDLQMIYGWLETGETRFVIR